VGEKAFRSLRDDAIQHPISPFAAPGLGWLGWARSL